MVLLLLLQNHENPAEPPFVGRSTTISSFHRNLASSIPSVIWDISSCFSPLCCTTPTIRGTSERGRQRTRSSRCRVSNVWMKKWWRWWKPEKRNVSIPTIVICTTTNRPFRNPEWVSLREKIIPKERKSYVIFQQIVCGLFFVVVFLLFVSNQLIWIDKTFVLVTLCVCVRVQMFSKIPSSQNHLLFLFVFCYTINLLFFSVVLGEWIDRLGMAIDSLDDPS